MHDVSAAILYRESGFYTEPWYLSKSTSFKVNVRRFTHSFVMPVLALFVALFLHANSIAQEVETAVTNQAIRIWHSPEKSSVIFDLRVEMEFKVFSLENPHRIVVDIPASAKAGLNISLPKIDDNPHVSAIRSGSPNPETYRYVIDTKKQLRPQSFVLPPNELYGYRLVVDLYDGEAASQHVQVDSASSTSVVENGAVEKPEAQEETTISEAQSSPVSQARPFVVAIDAGHGGEDPGALGHRGTHEKIITLSIAKKLQKVINQDPRMQAFLIRQGDYYIKLHKRRQMARAQGADIFISIHADAFTKSSANGLSVFALSQRGATSAMARALAAKENASDLIGGVSLADKDDMLAKVLVDLSMTATIGDSVNLGGRVLKELAKVGRLHSKRVEQAGFAVLKSPDMPSILVETGFITNPEEERKLRTSRYQSQIANAIYTAVGEFYEQTPYFNTGNYKAPSINDGVSSPAKGKPANRLIKHKVRSGDNLSTLASRYGTTIAKIKRDNKLKRNTLWIGEVLRIHSTSSTTSAVSGATSSKYKVQRGDSLSSISKEFNITIAALKRTNKLKNDRVYVGQTLRFPSDVKAPIKNKTHKVRRGDTLSEIAEKYGASSTAIMRLNRMKSKTVYLGQVLKIPG